MAVEQITRRQVVQFKDKLLASGQTPVNTNGQLTLLSSLTSFALKNSIIDQNPAQGVKVEVSNNSKEVRPPFDLSSLNAIFSTPVYVQGERPEGGKGEAAYWPIDPVACLAVRRQAGRAGCRLAHDRGAGQCSGGAPGAAGCGRPVVDRGACMSRCRAGPYCCHRAKTSEPATLPVLPIRPVPNVSRPGRHGADGCAQPRCCPRRNLHQI